MLRYVPKKCNFFFKTFVNAKVAERPIKKSHVKADFINKMRAISNNQFKFVLKIQPILNFSELSSSFVHPALSFKNNAIVHEQFRTFTKTIPISR